jgi:L-glutamine-phosphate cytidylyltransferase
MTSENSLQMLILAAGRGERLMPLTRNTPKSLIELQDGVTVLESQLRHIHAAGIQRVTIVGGYRVEQIEAKVKMYQDEFSMAIEVLYNPFFMTSNNLISLWIARWRMDEDFIILNGDDVFDEQVLPGLLAVDSSREICMVTDRKDRYTEDDMKVVIRGDRVLKVGKKLRPEETNGESIGMIRVIGAGRGHLRQKLDEMVRREESKNIFYLHAFQELMDEGWPVHYHEIRPDQWSEIDFHPDLEMVREQLSQRFKP